MSVCQSTLWFLPRWIGTRYAIQSQRSKVLPWLPSFVKMSSWLPTGYSAMSLSSVSSHILEQEEIINRFVNDPTELTMKSELVPSKKDRKSSKQSSTIIKDRDAFVAVKKNPRSQYKRGRVAKLVMRCAGEVLCGETNFGHLILLEQVNISEDLLQATITWTLRPTATDEENIDYRAFTYQLDNLCGHIQMQVGRMASLRRVPRVKFEQSL